MPTGNGVPPAERNDRPVEVFLGFQRPEANFLYCPNQFFDVCVSHYSRGTVRLVAHMLRQTIGFLDESGEPITEHVAVSYSDLIARAGISRGAVGKAIKDAIDGGFITQVAKGRSHTNGKAGKNAVYTLRWDEVSEYITEPKKFQGFYAGEGNRSPIPNQFFDDVLGVETLAVVKVVGAVLRHTIGYQTRFGGRRQDAPLSYSYLSRYANLSVGRRINLALQEATEKGYIRRVSTGTFNPGDRTKNQAAKYAVRWCENRLSEGNGSKRPLEKSRPDRFKKATGNGSKRPSEERFKKATQEITNTNNIYKQQQGHEDVPVAVEDVDSYKLLRETGFDQEASIELCHRATPEQIRDQVNWLERREPRSNPLGLLRRAIEGRWSEPADWRVRMSELSEESAGTVLARAFYAGFNQSTLDQVAQPSRADVEAAAEYVEHILATWNEPDRIGEWGMKFGSFVFNEKPDGMKIMAVPTAIRHFGNRWLQRVAKMREYEAKQQAKVAREKHQARHTAAWATYVDEQEQKLKQEYPKDYTRFINWQEEQRKRIENSRFDLRKDDALDWFDSDEKRRERLLGFFTDDILDFWQWDAKCNVSTFTL